MTAIKNPTSRRDFLRVSVTAASTFLLPAALAAAPVTAHRILTCNILLKLNEHEGTPMDWDAARRDLCIKTIRDQNADIICLQEVGPVQIHDFRRAFTGFNDFGFDGPVSDKMPERFQGIRNVTFYNNGRYKLIACNSYTLSNKPLIDGSRLAKRNIGRHVNWVRLQDRATGKQFRVLNTHLSLTPELRTKETAIIAEEAKQYLPDFPQFLCGDLNSRIFTHEQKILHETNWKDTYTNIHPEGSKDYIDPQNRIDFIYTRGKVQTTGAARFIGKTGEVPASDHPFFSADVILE